MSEQSNTNGSAMQILVGRPVSPGYAEGTAVLFDQGGQVEIPRYQIEHANVSDEIARFHEALERSCRELRQLEHRVLTELGDAQSSIFSAHLGLLEDKQFTERVKQRIRDTLVNVEQALDIEVADLVRLLASLENEYLRERTQDIRDVGNRMMRQLARGESDPLADLPPNSVIVAHELLPSETIDLDRKQVVAIVTEEGGENSHAAILARALGIPAVTAVAGAMSRIPMGARLLVDGQTGRVTMTPTDAAEHSFAESKGQYDDDALEANRAESLECVTRDGTKISLLANINRPHETEMVAAHHLDGVGLFRTEFLYMDSFDPPSFERQVATYRDVIDALDCRPLIIRTLDLGGDKIPAFLTSHHEANPNLGLRGLRFSLAEHKLFETQVRAILMASQGRDGTRLLLPMVLGAGDLEAAAELIRKWSSELDIDDRPPIGAMIETPASLFALDDIFQIAEFVCIGTNDLTQFMLAADRNSSELADDYSVLHPSVLRAIAKVVRVGREAGREVCVCGEAASYPRTAGLLVGLGARELSMSPLRAARVRYFLRDARISQLEELAERALSSRSVAAVRKLLEDLPTVSRCELAGQSDATR